MGDRIRVLHVEDDPAFADHVKDVLEHEASELTVRPVTDPGEALTELDSGAFECVVSDFDMPGTNGIDLLAAVRREHPDLPFILFTGKGSEEVASDAIAAGVTEYLQKEGGTAQFTVLANRIRNAVSKYRAQRHVERQREQFRSLFEEAPLMYAAIGISDGEPIVEDCNPGFLTRLGYDREDVIGHPLEAFYTEESTTELLDRRGFERALRGEFTHEERDLVAADGSVVETILRAAPRYDERGEIVGTATIYIDITERKRRERELGEAKRRLDLALQEASAGIWEWDLGTDELYWSDEILDLLGLDRFGFSATIEAFEGRLHPEDMARVEGAIEDTVAEGEAFQVELRMRTADGTFRWFDVRGQRLPSPDAQTMIGIAIDITERKEYEASLRRERDRLDNFARVISHDLRNPLNVATSSLELLREDSSDRHVDRVEHSLDRMNQLIDSLLELARTGSPVTDLEWVPFARVVDACWSSVATGDATLEVAAESSIRADESRLQQLLENLVRNAIEHGGDSVRITVGELPAGFFVADDGPGIDGTDPDDLVEIGYTSKPGGTGFGLAIVAEIVEAHGWELAVRESDAGGARFEVTGVEFRALGEAEG